MADSGMEALAWQVAAGLARSRNEGQAATAVARAAALLLEAEIVRLWMIDRERGYRFAGAWPEEETPPEEPPEDIGRVVALGAPDIAPAAKPFRSRILVSLLVGRKPVGVAEILERRRPAGAFAATDASRLAPLFEAAEAAIQGIRDRAMRDVRNLEAITRLTRLVDVGRTLASTFDLEQLSSFIANRARVSLEAQGAYLWMADPSGETLAVTAAEGPGGEAVRGWQLSIGEGLAGRVASSRESQLLNDADEIAELGSRPDLEAGLEIRSVAAVPVAFEDGTLLGVIEVVNKETEEFLEDGDVLFLKVVAETSALSIGNVRRLQAERRATDLGALLEAAQELGASLEVPKVSFTLVHKAAAILQYRQAAVGLLRPGGRFELAAVSGQTFVDEKQPEVRALRDILEWASGLPEGIYVVQEEDGSIESPRPETREKFQSYFQLTGARSFLTVPLADSDGRVGLFSMDAREPYAFGEHAMEASRLLAVQATIAIRNAMLYQQIPMARVMQPLARHKERFMSLPRHQRIRRIAGLVIVAVALLFPVPLRVSGDARVLPSRRLQINAEVAGRVTQVYVREGDRVDSGQVLAVLDDTDYRIGEEDARTRYEMARMEQTRLRAAAHTADAEAQAALLDGLGAELKLWDARLASTRIRARAAGLVATPHIEERVGTRLAQGDLFCELVDPGKQRVEILLPERDAGLVAEGMGVKVKLNAYPTRSLRARVERVGVVATVQEGERYFLVQTRLEPSGTAPRSGMTGLAKITVGRATVARILLRRPARWIWGLIWGWLP
jgi:GAF domain-containing protein